VVDLTSARLFLAAVAHHLSSKDSILFEQGDFRTSSRSAKGWDTTASSAARVLKKNCEAGSRQAQAEGGN
jgi:hypothetical protein